MADVIKSIARKDGGEKRSIQKTAAKKTQQKAAKKKKKKRNNNHGQKIDAGSAETGLESIRFGLSASRRSFCANKSGPGDVYRPSCGNCVFV